MKNKPIRILHVLATLNRGGAESMVMNLYRTINRKEIQFDFVVHTDMVGHFSEEVKQLGGCVFSCPKYIGINHFVYKKWWLSFLKLHSEYSIIHSHIRSCASIFLPIAKKFGITCIIHSHSTSENSDCKAYLKYLLESSLVHCADYFFACSNEAGKWLFGNKIVKQTNYKVIPNAIDVDKYKFNPIIRKEYREKLGVSEDTKVYVHVGRFHPSKNHKFLLHLFAEINKQVTNSILVLIGDGELRSQIEKQIDDFDLRETVKILGVQSDVNCWLQATDCMLFPSLWEGLGMVAIEAQAAGIPCICSEFIPKLVSVSNNCKFLPLIKDIWLKEIQCIDYTRLDNISSIQKAGFDIKTTSKYITDFYKGLCCGA